MPITNLSLYDGSTAAAEALTCAVRVHNRKAEQKDTVYISELTPPDRVSVIIIIVKVQELKSKHCVMMPMDASILQMSNEPEVRVQYMSSNRIQLVSSMVVTLP